MERRVRADETHAEEERLVAAALVQRGQFRRRPARVSFVRRGIAVIAVAESEVRGPAPCAVDPAVAGAPLRRWWDVLQCAERAVHRPDLAVRRGHLRMRHALPVLVPERAVISRVPELAPLLDTLVVHQLARAGHEVAVELEVLHQRLAILEHRVLEPLREHVVPRGVGVDAGQETRSRRRADRVVAVRPVETDSRRREPVEVRRARLGMPAERADEVVQIITDQQQHVGPLSGRPCRERAAPEHGVPSPSRVRKLRRSMAMLRAFRGARLIRNHPGDGSASVAFSAPIPARSGDPCGSGPRSA